jgi:hypothetical protein
MSDNPFGLFQYLIHMKVARRMTQREKEERHTQHTHTHTHNMSILKPRIEKNARWLYYISESDF